MAGGTARSLEWNCSMVREKGPAASTERAYFEPGEVSAIRGLTNLGTRLPGVTMG